jgi:hypothetical protein
MKDWEKIVLMVVGVLWGLGDCANKYKVKEYLQTESENPSEIQTPSFETQITSSLVTLSTRTILDEMLGPETTTNEYYGTIGTASRIFVPCERCENIVERRLCEKQRNELRGEIIGKLVTMTVEVKDVKKLEETYYEETVLADYGHEGYIWGYPVLKITDYDPDKHIMEFTLYHLMVKIDYGSYEAPTGCWKGYPNGPYFITFDPSIILKTQWDEEEWRETLWSEYKLSPQFAKLPFKKFTKEFSSDEEAEKWQENRRIGVWYVIRIEGPFAIYHPETGYCFYGLKGDIVGYKVTTWESKIEY